MTVVNFANSLYGYSNSIGFGAIDDKAFRGRDNGIESFFVAVSNNSVTFTSIANEANYFDAGEVWTCEMYDSSGDYIVFELTSESPTALSISSAVIKTWIVNNAGTQVKCHLSKNP